MSPFFRFSQRTSSRPQDFQEKRVSRVLFLFFANFGEQHNDVAMAVTIIIKWSEKVNWTSQSLTWLGEEDNGNAVVVFSPDTGKYRQFAEALSRLGYNRTEVLGALWDYPHGEFRDEILDDFCQQFLPQWDGLVEMELTRPAHDCGSFAKLREKSSRLDGVYIFPY